MVLAQCSTLNQCYWQIDYCFQKMDTDTKVLTKVKRRPRHGPGPAPEPPEPGEYNGYRPPVVIDPKQESDEEDSEGLGLPPPPPSMEDIQLWKRSKQEEEVYALMEKIKQQIKEEQNNGKITKKKLKKLFLKKLKNAGKSFKTKGRFRTRTNKWVQFLHEDINGLENQDVEEDSEVDTDTEEEEDDSEDADDTEEEDDDSDEAEVTGEADETAGYSSWWSQNYGQDAQDDLNEEAEEKGSAEEQDADVNVFQDIDRDQWPRILREHEKEKAEMEMYVENTETEAEDEFDNDVQEDEGNDEQFSDDYLRMKVVRKMNGEDYYEESAFFHVTNTLAVSLGKGLKKIKEKIVSQPSTGAIPKKRQECSKQSETNKKPKTASTEKNADLEGDKEEEGFVPSKEMTQEATALKPICSLCLYKKEELKDGRERGLTAEEKEVLEIRYEQKMEFLCLRHYKLEIRDFPVKEFCTNPFSYEKHKVKKRSLVKYPLVRDIARYTSLHILFDAAVCQNCHQKLKEKVEEEQWKLEVEGTPKNSQAESFMSSQGSTFSTASGLDAEECRRMRNQESVQDVFKALDLSPLKLNLLEKKPDYLKSKVGDIERALREKLNLTSGVSAADKTESEQEIISSIRAQIQGGKSREEIIKLLSILPKDWTYQKFINELGVTRCLVESVKEFQRTGIIPKRKSRSDKVDAMTIEKIKEFYTSPGISRQMPGVKDFIRVGEEDLQKFVLVMSIDDAHLLFQEQHPEYPCGITTFFLNKPPNVVYCGSKGTVDFCLW